MTVRRTRRQLRVDASDAERQRARAMAVPSALACVRCGARYPVDHYAQDCPACRARGAPANLTVAFESVLGIGTDRDAVRRDRGSMWRWDKFLHASAVDAVTL